jgi:hypothetical protein
MFMPMFKRGFLHQDFFRNGVLLRESGLYDLGVCILPFTGDLLYTGSLTEHVVAKGGASISENPVKHLQFLQGCNGKTFLLERERMGSILNEYKVSQIDMGEFVQHLEPWACGGYDTEVFPPHVSYIKTIHLQMTSSASFLATRFGLVE